MRFYIPFYRVRFYKYSYVLNSIIKLNRTYFIRFFIAHLLNGDVDYCWNKLESWMGGCGDFWDITDSQWFKRQRCIDRNLKRIRKEGRYICGKCDPKNQLKTANDYNKYYLNK